MNKKVYIKNNILYIDGRKKFMLTADYPYYRDTPDLWNKKLKLIKKTGIDIVTFYIPWRHHFIDNRFDFTGKTASNRNVIKFINLCKKNNLYAIIKPGPFIHGETDFGGLPDFLNPETNKKIEPYSDINGKPNYWGKYQLPSPVCKEFLSRLKNWLYAVKENILEKFKYPSGPVIALQIWNEGIFSDANAEIYKYDFSPSSVELFKKLFKLNPPDKFPDKKIINQKSLLSYYFWAEYQSEYMKFLYNFFKKTIKTDLPLLININPPARGDRKFFAWLSRNIVEKWKGINFGYTNWIGVVSYNKDSFYRYLTILKRTEGINMEENWGFSKLYDKKYKDPNVSYFQSIFNIACGAKGLNIYTFCATDRWDENIDSYHLKPYPATPPVNAEGKKDYKYPVLKKLVDFIKANEEFLLNSEPLLSFYLALYPPDMFYASWNLNKKLNYKSLLNFMEIARKNFLDFKFINLRETKIKKDLPLILMDVSNFDKIIWEKLYNFLKDGGKLIIGISRKSGKNNNHLHKLLNKANSYNILNKKTKEYIFKKGRLYLCYITPLKEANKFFKNLIQLKIIKPLLKTKSFTEFFILKHKSKQSYFLFLFNRSCRKKKVKLFFRNREIDLTISAHSTEFIQIREKGI